MSERNLTHEEYKAKAKEYLADVKATLWADWDISKPEGVEQAANWLATQFVNVIKHEKVNS